MKYRTTPNNDRVKAKITPRNTVPASDATTCRSNEFEIRNQRERMGLTLLRENVEFMSVNLKSLYSQSEHRRDGGCTRAISSRYWGLGLSIGAV